MAGSKSDAYEQLMLQHTLGNQAFTAPGTVYVGLWTATLSDTSTGATAGEVSGGAYARAAVPNSTVNWTYSAGSIANGTAITFAAATANWGTVTYAALLNASTSGTILYYWDLPTSKVISSGDTASFAVSSIVITEA